MAVNNLNIRACFFTCDREYKLIDSKNGAIASELEKIGSSILKKP